MEKKGLVLEGGAMRGLWTAGVIDVMMEAGIKPDGIIGVSAGAAFGCNYKSQQPGRAIRYNKRFAKDRRYSGWHSLFRSGDYFNAEFAYHIVPHDYDIFDSETFANNPIEFTVVCTDVTTGKAVYHQLDHVDYETLEWIRASASMPMVSRVVPIGNHQLLDGGVSDSIPLAYYESLGYKRNIVILTQPAGYRKSHNALMPLMCLALRHYPNMIEAMDQRHLMYNRQLDYVTQAEKEGRCLVIRPEGKIPIGHLCHDPKRMQLVYELGREVGHKQLDAIKEYYR